MCRDVRCARSTPTQLSVAAAAKAYLDIVGPYNTAVEDLEDAINSGQPIETQTDRAAATLNALEAEIDQLDSTAWPGEIRPHIEELVAISEQATAHWQAAAEAHSAEELVQAVLSAAEFDGTEVANTIRHLLGLDDYDENA